MQIRVLLLLIAVVIPGCHPDEPAAQRDPVDPGLQIYRDGLLPSGEPLTAVVAGGVAVSGTHFNCEGCHGRSGMGGAEASYVVPPIAGPFLFTPSPQPSRPAYDLDSLASVLRDGITPGGRVLDTLMPRYDFPDETVALLGDYLESLSAQNSPGVDENVIRFATVYAGNIDPAERAAVAAVLSAYGEDNNRQTRLEGERWDRGYTPESRLPTVYREWVFEEWSLVGPRETWEAQLDTYYRDSPVFALVSGLTQGPWTPVAKFCEREGIPCLYPGVDVTGADDDDFYTFYFSRGLELEADIIARHLQTIPAEPVVQVFCDPAGRAAAARLTRALDIQGRSTSSIEFDCAEADSSTVVSQIAGNVGALVGWLDTEGMERSGIADVPAALYVSSTLLGIDGIATSPRGTSTFLVHPYRLPGEADPAFARFQVWAKLRGVEITSPRRQAEAFFAARVINNAVAHMGRFFIRDFVLDKLEHAQGLVAYLPIHPRPTLGPGQRFATKGGYLVPLHSDGLAIADAFWVSP